MPEKVTDPTKIVTDEQVLNSLAKQGIDKDYVEFWQDYAPHSLGKEHSPYAKFYRDLKSNKRLMVVSGLPKVKPDGQKIDVGWKQQDTRYVSKANLFSAIVNGKQITVTCLSDQPSGTKKGEQVTWQPQLFVDGSEIINGEQATLLPVDPINAGYTENTLEWSYGIVCKRRIRILEGRFREKWVFESNPHSTVKIKHNFTGSLKLNLGSARDAAGNTLKVNVIDDEEIVEASEFDKAVYPVEIGASQTFYPDASSVDGNIRREAAETWHTKQGHTDGTLVQAAVASARFGGFKTTLTPNWIYIWRSWFLFLTSGLPNACRVTGAVFSVVGTLVVDNLNVDPAINVYLTTPASDDALVNGDYDQIGTVAYATEIAEGAWNAAGYNDFTLIDVDTDDFGYISRIGVTKLGLRESNYDAPDIEPAHSDNLESSFSGDFTEQGTGFKPTLVVTYTVAEAKSGNMGAKMIGHKMV